MTDPNELVIRVFNGDGDTLPAGPPARPVPAEGGGAAVKRSRGTLAEVFLAREIKSVSSQAVSFVVSNVGITTGNSISQERMQYALNAGTKLAAYGTAIVTGNLVAAGIMAASDVVALVEKTVRLELQNSVERESLALARERAGVAFNASRLGAAK